jgi:hypothetical protein
MYMYSYCQVMHPYELVLTIDRLPSTYLPVQMSVGMLLWQDLSVSNIDYFFRHY